MDRLPASIHCVPASIMPLSTMFSRALLYLPEGIEYCAAVWEARNNPRSELHRGVVVPR